MRISDYVDRLVLMIFLVGQRCREEKQSNLLQIDATKVKTIPSNLVMLALWGATFEGEPRVFL
jgi:hypothetical protein